MFFKDGLTLEQKRKIAELERVKGALAEQYFIIEERKEDILRVQKNIEIQEAKIKELEEAIAKF